MADRTGQIVSSADAMQQLPWSVKFIIFLHVQLNYMNVV